MFVWKSRGQLHSISAKVEIIMIFHVFATGYIHVFATGYIHVFDAEN
jgi:hypothetical protein